MNNIKSLVILILLYSFTFCLPPLPYPWQIPYFLSKALEPDQDESNQNQSNSNNESIMGQIDTSFGSGGYTIFDIPGTSETPEALVFKNGKILQGGYCDGLPNSKFCLVQFDSNGNIDTSFGTSGYVIFDVPGSSYEYNTSLGLQGDKIIQSGECSSSDGQKKFCLVRYNSDGSIDTSFNNPNGYRIYAMDTSNHYPKALAIQADGKILQGGHCTGGANYFCITRYVEYGHTDYGFNPFLGYNKPNIIPTTRDYAYSLAIQSDGKILQGGYCGNSTVGPFRFCLMRYHSDGTIDTSFGTGGYVLYDIPASTWDMANSLAIQTNGKILQGGTCQVSGTNQFCVVRYNSDGSIDTSFGTGGYLFYDVAGITNGSANSLVVEDQFILIGGNCDNKFCVVRIN